MLTEKCIYKERVFQTTIIELWQKWSTSAGLRTFFGVDNNMELRIGGPFEIIFLKDSPTGQQGSEGCVVLSWLPEKMISFTWNAPPHLPVRSSSHKTIVVLFFENTNEKNQTKLKLYHHHWPEGEEWENCYAYFDKAWEAVLQSLQNSL